MSADGASAVEREAELLAEALGRAWGRTAPSTSGEAEQNGRGDEGRAAPTRWIHEHGPELLRSIADVTALVSDGLRVLADHVEEAGADRETHAGGDKQPQRGMQGDGPQDRRVRERHEEQA